VKTNGKVVSLRHADNGLDSGEPHAAHLARLIAAYAPHDGSFELRIPGLRANRFTNKQGVCACAPIAFLVHRRPSSENRHCDCPPHWDRCRAQRWSISSLERHCRDDPGIGNHAYNLCSSRRICAAMIMHGAMVLPVVTRGMIEPSAMRRFSIP
jgi:hypothetical protein